MPGTQPESEASRALQACLELLESGEETIATVLARYPQYAEQLRPELEAWFWIHQRSAQFAVRPGFVAGSRRRLLARLAQATGEKAFFSPPRAVKSAPRSWLRWGRQTLRLAAVLALVAAVLFSGTGVAFASQGAQPGDVLYLLKYPVENIRAALSPGLARQTGLRILFVNRRLSELESAALNQFPDLIPRIAANFDDQARQVDENLQKLVLVDPAAAAGFAKELQTVLAREGVVLSALAQAGFGAERPEMVQFRQAADQILQTAGSVLSAAAEAGSSPSGTAPSDETVQVSATLAIAPVGDTTPGAASTPTPTLQVSPAAGGSSPVPATAEAGPQETPKPHFTHTPKPTNTHRPTDRPPKTKETKEPKETREPKPTLEPKPTKDKE